MERLRFTYSRCINDLEIKYNSSLGFEFIIAYGQTVIRWGFRVAHVAGPFNLDDFVLSTRDSQGILNFHDWNCKFILKRANQSDLECTVSGVKNRKSFHVPTTHEIPQFFMNFFKKPVPRAALQLILDLPKDAFFAKNWPICDLPRGRRKYNDYKILTIDDNYDMNFVCKDGVFYAKKDDFIRIDSKYEELFWNKQEVKVNASLEIIKMVASYLFTFTFIAPKEMKQDTFIEIHEATVALRLPDDLMTSYSPTLDSFVCSQMDMQSFSLYDLVVSWIYVGTTLKLHCLLDFIESVIVKKYFNEVTSQYQYAFKTYEDKEKEIFVMLHSKEYKYGKHSRRSLFECLRELHTLSRRAIVTEVVKQD